MAQKVQLEPLLPSMFFMRDFYAVIRTAGVLPTFGEGVYGNRFLGRRLSFEPEFAPPRVRLRPRGRLGAFQAHGETRDVELGF